MKPTVCVTTFVFGKKYQGYIPLLIYSLLKSYPDYVPVIFVHGELRSDIRTQLESLNSLGSFYIKDNYYENFKTLNNFEGKSLRWTLRDDFFFKFDYVYFVDIDIVYFKEEPPLHIQHIEHMNVLKTPFSNTMRFATNKNRSCKMILRRIKRYGIKNAMKNFFKGNISEKKLTGLHFVKTKEYFQAVENAQKRHEDILFRRAYHNEYQGFNNESVLYNICLESKFNMENVGIHSNYNGLDYRNYNQSVFRPHHGIHLGLFRSSAKDLISDIANSLTYKYYLKNLKLYLNDPIFIKLLRDSDGFIKNHFLSLFHYYNMPFQNIF